ncbi:hypothetical protein GGI21_004432, partial [Coemansia aciculifera]
EPPAMSLRPPKSITRRAQVSQVKPPQPKQAQQTLGVQYTGGGKSGYNLAIAAAQKRYMLECDSDSSSSDEQMEDVTETADNQQSTVQTPAVTVPIRSYTPPPALAPPSPQQTVQLANTKPKRPYKRRTLATTQKSSSSSSSTPRRATLSPVVGRGRKCSYCGCNETPIWRRGPGGTGTLCNACGVRWKLGKILQ